MCILRNDFNGVELTVSHWFHSKAEFEKMAEDVKQVKTRPTDKELLNLYGLYKQSLVGDINIGMFCHVDSTGMYVFHIGNAFLLRMPSRF